MRSIIEVPRTVAECQFSRAGGRPSGAKGGYVSEVPEDIDLRLAVALGFLTLPTPGGGVRLEDGVLRYDPELPGQERRYQIASLLLEWAEGRGIRTFWALHKKCADT